MSDHAEETNVDIEQQPQQQNLPRSVKDFASDADLRRALSRLLAPKLSSSETCAFTRSDTASTGSSFFLKSNANAANSYCPFSLEPDPEYDLDWRVDNVDRAKSYEQTVEREMNRLLVLKSYLDLDYEAMTARNCAFDRLTGLAKRTFQAPACFVFLLDIGRSWALSQDGKPFNLVPRKDTFCGHVIVSKQDCFIVPDASKNPRFERSAYVTAENGVRFYAACPLKSPEGFNIGTFCIVDIVPRDSFTSDDQEALKDFSRLAMDALVHQRELHCKRQELSTAARRLASASHDLLTPLSVVQLSISLLNEDCQFLDRLDETQREYIKAVSASSATMANVCQSLRHKLSNEDPTTTVVTDATSTADSTTVSETDSDSSTVKPMCTRTDKLVQRLNELAAVVVTNTSVPVSISVDESVPDVWVGNEVQILQICLHVLVNSVEHTTVGHVTFTIRRCESSCGEPELIFECTDTGAAMCEAKADLSAIFEEQVLSSYSVKSQEARDHENQDGRCSPLGILSPGCVRSCDLYECFPTTMVNEPSLESFSTQLRSLGGSFGVAENPTLTHETTFWFKIPLILPEGVEMHDNGLEQQVTVTADKSSTFSPTSESRKQALIVDDSVIMRKMLSRALEQLGYETIQAADGLEGLKLMRKHRYDLVLLDFLMPVMDGLDCVRSYRAWEKEHRPGYIQLIYGMSAHASPNDIDRGIASGMTDYRPKPLNLVDLRNLKESTLRKQQTGAFLRAQGDANAGLDYEEEPSLRQDTNLLDSPYKSVHDDNNRLLQSGEKICLLAMRSGSEAQNLEGLVAETGWHSCVTQDGEEALRLLKTRNWGAVIIDTELAELDGLKCIASFRQWEKNNRVHRQNNMLLMGVGGKPRRANDQLFVVQLPEGVDAAIERPKCPDELARILNGIVSRGVFDEEDIITLG
ncbi:hypothetical protein MPSEU_000819900 [Mayamaea pseudoterrestris]|nr:hypothetical protein MPSEU_000819900 [Mayamaea pseudoterrestris]